MFTFREGIIFKTDIGTSLNRITDIFKSRLTKMEPIYLEVDFGGTAPTIAPEQVKIQQLKK
jgi:hypothetical protein